MKEQDKELLFKDLCARLPYHVKVKVWLKDGTTEEGKLDLEHNYGDVLRDAFYYNKIVDIKPYLRPMSSMTEEEWKEYDWFIKQESDELTQFRNKIKFYNKHHIDYNGLIPMDLALEAPKGMYNIFTDTSTQSSNNYNKIVMDL